MRFRALLAAPALAAALLLPGATTGVAPVAAAPASSCSPTSGVLVVVDLRHFGGALTRGCDPSPSTGYEALHAAGYTTEGTRHDGPAYVCRIDGYPSATQEPCVNTPPANSYWSYWHAAAGHTNWTYSSLGAQSSHPTAGSIDAWVFGSTDLAGTSGGPAFTPAEARGQRTTGGGSAVTAKPGSSRSGSASGREATSTASPVRTPARTAASSPSPAGSATSPTDASSQPSTAVVSSAVASSAIAPGSSRAARPSFAEASSVAPQSSSDGSPWPVLLGVALVLLLGAGGGWGVLRRRRADAADQ